MRARPRVLECANAGNVPLRTVYCLHPPSGAGKIAIIGGRSSLFKKHFRNDFATMCRAICLGSKMTTCCRCPTTLAKSFLAWDLSPPYHNKKMVLIEHASPAAAAEFFAAAAAAATWFSANPEVQRDQWR